MSSSPNRPLHTQDTGMASPYNTNVLLAAVIALSAAIIFVILLHLYGRCLLERRPSVAADIVNNPHALHQSSNNYEFEVRVSIQEGLDATDLAALPVFVCKSKEDGAVHCVVCLGEMEDGELGRLLPACRHIFHVECIDTWLSLSSTCPVCRMKVRTDEMAVPVTGSAPASVAEC